MIAKLFRKEKTNRSEGNKKNKQLPGQEAIRSVDHYQQTTYPRQFNVGCAQSVGRQRTHNEDSVYYNTSIFADGKGSTEVGLFILADGMGGHRNGEVASAVTCRVVARNLIGFLNNQAYQHGTSLEAAEIVKQINNSIADAQEAVLQNAPGGGTTVVIALLIGNQLTLANVGDSRIYIAFDEGKLNQVTRDHSLVQRLMDLDEISPSEAEVHPQKNVLLRAIGQPQPFQADIQTMEFPDAAKLLLCTDGLWGVVGNQNMCEIIKSEHDAILASKKLVDAANRNGGPDNISVIIAGYR